MSVQIRRGFDLFFNTLVIIQLPSPFNSTQVPVQPMACPGRCCCVAGGRSSYMIHYSPSTPFDPLKCQFQPMACLGRCCLCMSEGRCIGCSCMRAGKKCTECWPLLNNPNRCKNLPFSDQKDDEEDTNEKDDSMINQSNTENIGFDDHSASLRCDSPAQWRDYPRKHDYRGSSAMFYWQSFTCWFINRHS